MSYCVNCGVELDASLEACPLCNTAVLNPREIPSMQQKPSFPQEKGQVEMVKRKDLGILLTTVLVSTAVTCGLLNLLVYNATRWSLLVIGICMILWVLFVPVVIYTRMKIYTALFLDGLAVVFYLYLITFITDTERWYWGLGLPLTVFVTLVLDIFAVCVRKISRSILGKMIYFFVSIAVLCVGIELLIDRFLGKSLWLTWSAVVLTVCVIISIILITMLSLKRIRNIVRRRLHF